MSRNYDNWERLVAAVIKRQQLWELFHAHSRTPSDLSEASDFSLSSQFDDKSELVFVCDCHPVFQLEDLLSGSFKRLGKGNFGVSYTAKLDEVTTAMVKGNFGFSYITKLDDGISFVVKRLNMVNNISEQDFKKHMAVVGDVKHENVAQLMAYCYSQEEKLMIYDHHKKGSVSELLHGQIGENRAISHVPWNVRLKIAIGAARGICHIHTQNGGEMVHGNIKASNIFLNSQRYGLVSDLGLANMIPTTFVQSSKCYAPEVRSTQDVSQASDVYSYGILLLELLTRKSTEPSFGHEAVDIVKLVTSASLKEWNTKVFDKDLLLIPSIKEQVVRMLEIGISCVAKAPKKRPKMSVVASLIENIFRMNIENAVYEQTESQRLVFLGDGIPTFYHEDLVLASVEILGKGTFGTSYKAILEKGNAISVKRLKNVIVTNEEFQQHMEVIGRMGHENVTELRAYYYSMGEQLLVYDHYYEGRLSAMLQGKRPLDWDIRLNIAVGAAKGIAHIHTKNEQKLVHGNIKASNIFSNKQQYGIVSDVGLEKLVDPTTFLFTRNQEYSAPEVTDHTELSQASDVYSFGVVLLELLSGKPSQITYNGEAMSLVRRAQTALREERIDEVFDPAILMHKGMKENMERMMQKAMYCVASVPEKRPFMADVVKMLEEIQADLPLNLDIY